MTRPHFARECFASMVVEQLSTYQIGLYVWLRLFVVELLFLSLFYSYFCRGLCGTEPSLICTLGLHQPGAVEHNHHHHHHWYCHGGCCRARRGPGEGPSPDGFCSRRRRRRCLGARVGLGGDAGAARAVLLGAQRAPSDVSPEGVGGASPEALLRALRSARSAQRHRRRERLKAAREVARLAAASEEDAACRREQRLEGDAATPARAARPERDSGMPAPIDAEAHAPLLDRHDAGSAASADILRSPEISPCWESFHTRIERHDSLGSCCTQVVRECSPRRAAAHGHDPPLREAAGAVGR